jgi:hypothetical protein
MQAYIFISISLSKKYFSINKVVKLNAIYDLSHEFSGLNHETRVNLICCCLNVKKKDVALNFFKSNHDLYQSFGLSINLSSQPSHV